MLYLKREEKLEINECSKNRPIADCSLQNIKGKSGKGYEMLYGSKRKRCRSGAVS